jgi:hypothetical protein
MRWLCVSCERNAVVVPGFVAETQDKHRFSAHHECVTDVPPESRPVPPPEPDPGATHVLPPDQVPGPPRQRFVDRLWSFRALIAVALASVIIGGLAGAALASAGDDNDRRGGPMRFQRGGPMAPPGGRHWQWDDGPGSGPGSGQGTDPMPRWRGPQQGDGNGPRILPPNSAPTPSPRAPKATPSP